MFNLWIYQRRASCLARMQHSGPGAFIPLEKREEAVADLLAEWIAVNADQPIQRDDNVLPFRAPRETAQRGKPRGRPKGRIGG